MGTTARLWSDLILVDGMPDQSRPGFMLTKKEVNVGAELVYELWAPRRRDKKDRAPRQTGQVKAYL